MTRPGPQLDRAARLGLAAMGVAVLVIANDFTSLSVAIPAIEATFVLALGGLAVALFFIGGPVDPERLRDRRHHHRAHV